MRWLLIVLLCMVGCTGSAQEAVSVNTTAIYEQGYTEGYNAGVAAGVASVECPPEPKWYNPTYREVESFIREDDTQKLAGHNNCADLVRRIVGKASAIGWNVTIGEVYTNCGYGHGFAVFKTSDKGIVFVDPFTDMIYPQKLMVKGNYYPLDACKIDYVVEQWIDD
jgi:hypothetical protein